MFSELMLNMIRLSYIYLVSQLIQATKKSTELIYALIF